MAAVERRLAGLDETDLGRQLQGAVPAEPLVSSEQARRRAQQVLASIGRDGWCCGTRGAVESAGLMNGIAGIGYGLLRLAEPGRVPSPLALAPPGVLG